MKEKILVCENLEIFYKNNKIIDNLSFSVEDVYKRQALYMRKIFFVMTDLS